MKRKLSVLLAALMVLSFAGQAAAFFEDLHLIRSIYTTTGTVEVGTDLGLDVSTFSLTDPINQQRNPDVALSAFGAGLNTLVVGYWAHDMAKKDFYATGNYNDGDGLSMGSRKQGGADTTYNSVQSTYGASGSATTVVDPKVGSDGYFKIFEKGGQTTGGMNDNMLSTDYWEMTLSLAELATAGYVDQYLYFFDYDGSTTAKAGVEVAVIRTFLTSDGSTIDLVGNQIATLINPSSSPVVPVPAAVWLLGTGIVALVGIRRRNS